MKIRIAWQGLDEIAICIILLLVMCVVLFWAHCRMNHYRDLADMYLGWIRSAMDRAAILQEELDDAERDMATMLDCCDICGHNNNPNCPGDICETCGVICHCRECRNSSEFVWKGNMETERRSGIYDTGNGETQDGGGDRKGPPETVYSAQAGSGVRKGAD